MIQILVAAAIALVTSIALSPVVITVLVRRGYGQEIRADGPASHLVKRGTPPMGGIAILLGMWTGYLASNFIGLGYCADGPSASGLLVLGLATALGVVGFLDDFIKLKNKRSLGLTAIGKFVGQIIAALVFAILALQFRNEYGLTPASKHLSFTRDVSTLTFGAVGFLVLVSIITISWSNAVNITDGLDGLAAGSMTLALGGYVIITSWQSIHSCATRVQPGCYEVRDPQDLAIVCAAGAAACIGFLWWNAAPAKIIMGDTGALALGGLIAGLSVTTRTELLMVVVGALFCAEILSVLLQIVVFKTTGNRLFRMAPFHHHFELANWAETTVTIRFWLLVGVSTAVGLGIFCNEYLSAG